MLEHVYGATRGNRGEADAFWDLRPSGRQRAAADPALRGSVEADRGVRPRRVLWLPSGRAPQHAARLCAVAGGVFGRRGATDPAIAVRADGLSVAALSPAAADRRDLHARP